MTASRRVQVPDGALACEEAGAGPAVVLLHGFSFDRRLWNPLFPALSDGYRVVRYDLRGFGASTPPALGRGHVADLVVLLDDLGIERATLVGLSLGANVALAAALDHPDRVDGLVLASPGLPGHQWSQERPPEAALAVAARHGVEAARRFWLDHPVFASTRAYPPARAALEQMVASFPAHQWRGAPVTPPLPAVADRLGMVETPTLVVNGELDVDGYREIGSLIAHRVPRAAHVTVPAAGHVMCLERPDEFERALRGFLVQLAGAPSVTTPDR
ncbi:alpha/beta fold hydrolase [Nocardioides sp. DS6]|uniref:Alpha/beta fold hydrolase n=1 Tax=Nocardioides eburneus TaxID=3231482 RepID=A0ABV3SZI7_9ACTN